MGFLFLPLNQEYFTSLFNLTDEELSKKCITKVIADKKPGFPCRVSLQDAEVGEELFLLPYIHHNIASPYQASGPIYVRKNIKTASFKENEIPQMMNHRLLSLRGYDENGMMKYAEVVKGDDLANALNFIFTDNYIEYIHIHNARPGCYNCKVVRV